MYLGYVRLNTFGLHALSLHVSRLSPNHARLELFSVLRRVNWSVLVHHRSYSLPSHKLIDIELIILTTTDRTTGIRTSAVHKHLLLILEDRLGLDLRFGGGLDLRDARALDTSGS
jgi:hypothetical protein